MIKSKWLRKRRQETVKKSQTVNTRGGWFDFKRAGLANWIRFWSSIPEELRLYSFRLWLGFFHHQNIPRDRLLFRL